ALRTATLNPYRDELQRFGIEVLLTSANALEPVATDDPLAASDPACAPLAARAFDAASTLLAFGRDALSADQHGALFAWRQSFGEDSRNSELSQTRQRLARFVGNTIPRVGEKRWKTLLPRTFRGRHGSPLSALRLGTQGVPRK
ncbi:autotransporter, partial [Mesorhizobium sp. M3A.F.Ca.ET.174.01.1.1]